MTRARELVVVAAVLSSALGCSAEDGGGSDLGDVPGLPAGTAAPSPTAGVGGAPLATAGAAAPIAGTEGPPAPVAGAAPQAGAPAAGADAEPLAGAAGVVDTGGMGGASDPAPGGSPGMDPVVQDDPVCDLSAHPAEFEPNESVGGGGAQFVDSAHFRIYGASGSAADGAIQNLEAAYACFVETLCWRSSGLSIRGGDDGPFYKMNIYAVGSLGGAAGQMFSDFGEGQSYLRVVTPYLAQPTVTVHEYGHSLTYYEQGWIDQTRTGAWWETVANFVADTFMTSPLCAEARDRFGVSEGRTLIELNRVIGDSHQVLVDGSAGSGNYYQAWPFLTYLTNNPDHYDALGKTALRDMFRSHPGNNDTPLHVLESLTSVPVQTIVGRYWARMAYLDIGHPQAQEEFLGGGRSEIAASLDATGGGSYRVRGSVQPRYFGANLIPLDGSGTIGVQVTSAGAFTATLAIRSASGSFRYVDLPGGSGEATLEAGEDATLVVVNTPATLIQYDPFSIGGEVAQGLDYEVQLTGATPTN